MNKIVLITDEALDVKNADISNRNMEKNLGDDTERIVNSLCETYGEIIHYTSLETFSDKVKKHIGDIVFPMYYGVNKASSKALAPAICESFSIKYVGADSYAHTLCNDKHLSKLYAAEFGIQSSKCVLIRPSDSLNDCKNKISSLNLPIIAKPNYGGCSTGISINGISHSYADALLITQKLLKYHQMSILVEEYIPGHEIDYVIMGNKNEIILEQEIQLIMDGEEYFEDKIWGFETKKVDFSSVKMRPSDMLPIETKIQFINLFKSFDKIEFMRIDGRINNGQFYLIELSPDAYLGDDCAVYEAFRKNGYSHSAMLKKLIDNSQRSLLISNSQ